MSEGPIELRRGARLLGHLAWTEQQLHAVVGAWVLDTPEPAAAVALDRQALHHAWRAATLVDRLPRLRELPRDELVASPSDDVRVGLESLAATAGTGGRLAGLLDVVVPCLLGAYRGLGARLTPVADAPLQRWLPLVEADLLADATAVAEVRVDVSPGGTAPDAIRRAFGTPDALAGATGLRLA